MPFDRTAPFEVVEEPPAPTKFDPAQPFEDVRQNFDPGSVLLDPERAKLHATPEGEAAINGMFATQPDEEGKMRVANQLYVSRQLTGMPFDTMVRNWGAVRDGYAKKHGYTEGTISEGAFTALLQKAEQDKLKDRWAITDFFGRLIDMYGLEGYGDRVQRFGIPVGAESAGTKGQVFTIPKMQGTGPFSGIIDATNRFTVGMLTPENVALAAATGGAGKVAQIANETRIAVLARSTQAAALGTFTVVGAKDTAQAFTEAQMIVKDPNATSKEIADAFATTILSGLMTAAAAKGTYDFATMAAKGPTGETAGPETHYAEAAERLREEAKRTGNRETKAALNQVADDMDAAAVKVAEEAKAAEAAKKPAEPEPVPEKPAATMEELDGGGYVVTDRDGARVYVAEKADAEGLVAQLADETAKPAEIAPQAPAEPGRQTPQPADQTGPKAAEMPELADSAAQAVVGIKNASVDEALAKMGREPATHGEKLSFEQARADAAAKMEADPRAGENLVKSLEADPRPVTGKENALLLHELTRLTNERAAAETALIEAANMGDTVALSEAKARVERATADYVRAAEVDTKVGTANAIGLALRRMMMKEDYSLAAMERRRMVANEGKPLSEGQRAEVAKLHEEIAAKDKALADYMAGKTPAPEPKAARTRSAQVIDFLGKEADAARARISARLEKIATAGLTEGEKVSSLLSKENLSDLAVVGADYLAKGTVKLAEFSEKMVKEFGEAVRPHLKDLFARSSDLVESAKAEQAMGRTKARLEARIEELQKKIATGDTSTRGQKATRPDVEVLEKLKQERDRLNEQMAELRNPEKTPEQARLAQIEGRIAQLEEQIASGEIFPAGKKPSVSSPEIQAAEKRLEELTLERDSLRESLQPSPEPKTAQEKRLAAFKSRKEARIEELNRRIKEGDFTPKAKPEPLHLDETANRLQAEAEVAKLEYDRLLERDRYEKSSAASKAAQQALSLYDAGRLLMTTGEFSFILRQGKVAALSRPLMTLKAIPDTIRSFMNDPAGAHAIDLKVLNHPDAPAARTAKLHLIEEGAKLSRQEEILVGRILSEKIPVIGSAVGRFNQAATTFLNRIRFDLWNQMRKVGMTAAEEKQLAMFVNEATGRGGLGSLEQAAVPLGRLMFSPRFFASRIQLATGHSLWGGTYATRRAIAKEYARTLIGLGLYYSALKLAFTAGDNDVEIGEDPRSSDFGKVRIGNTRLDPLAGVAQVAVFASRTATGEKANAAGRVTDIRGPDVPFGGDRWTDVAARFARSKLHPVPGAIANLFDGTDLGGNEATLLNQGVNLSGPVTYADIYQALEEQDLPEGVALGLLAMLGEGVQTYNARTAGTSAPPSRK